MRRGPRTVAVAGLVGAGLAAAGIAAAAGVLTAGPALPGRPGLVFQVDFEDGLRAAGGRLTQEGNRTPRVTVVAGRRALEVALDHRADAMPIRTELVPKRMDPAYFDNGGLDARIGGTYWYALKTLIPRDFRNDRKPEIITQFHDYPDETLGEDWKSPAVDLTLEPWSDGTQHYMVSVRSDTKRITPAGGGDLTAGKYTAFTTYDLGPVAPSTGRWIEWVWKIKWGYDNTGDLTLWRDGKQVLDLPNQGNCFNDALGPYMKFGIYKWDWAAPEPTGTDRRTVYYDDVRIAAGPRAGYESVADTADGLTAPRPGPPPDLPPLRSRRIFDPPDTTGGSFGPAESGGRR